MGNVKSIASRTVWDLDPAHTQVEFSAKHMMFTTVRGRFDEVSGAIGVDEENPAEASVNVEIGAASIDTGAGDRDKHLRSADFLDVQNHPRLTFRSTRVDGGFREPGDHFRVTGDLTIRGQSREVELDVVYEGRGPDPWGGERSGFTAKTTIDRREWGLTWNQALETGGILVGHEIRIELSVQAVRRAEAEG